MGAWGCGPLDNDSAADWFGDLMEVTGFRDRIAAALASGHEDKVRAAAWVVGQLGRVYVWPIDSLKADRIAAGAGVLRILHDEDWLDMWGSQAEVKTSLRAQLKPLKLTSKELAAARESAGLNTAPAKAAKTKATKKKAKATKKKAKATKKKAKATKKKAKATKGWLQLTYEDEKSSKFWSIRVHASSHTVRYGRLGTDGREKTKEFESPAEAKAAATKLEAQKRKKGYL